MFLTAKDEIKETNDLISDETIFQFSLAEFSSAVEMLQAAKLSTNYRLKIGFILHALDEYRHLDFFRSVLKERNSNLNFMPILSIVNKYIDTERFLFEKMNLIQFSAFVSVNERFAYILFSGLKDKLFEKNSHLDQKLDIIIDEERMHQMQTDRGYLFECLINDEMGHFSFSMKFLLKNASLLYSRILILKYTLRNRLRHYFGKKTFIKNFFEFIIINLVLITLKSLRQIMFFDLRIGSFSTSKKCLKMMI